MKLLATIVAILIVVPFVLNPILKWWIRYLDRRDHG